MRFLPAIFAALLLVACGGQQAAQQGPVVLAASSMQEALEEASAQWQGEGHPVPVLSFAASSAVARQVAEGAPADMIVTADEEWMDWLQARGRIDTASRRNVAGNTLVLIAPADAPAPATIAAALAGFDGRLAIAEPQSVPAGRYARAALGAMGLWDGIADRVVPAENVRAAMALVERGEVALGVVYGSDAAASPRVRVVGTFDPASHSPIRYPAARVASSKHRDAAGFLDFLAGDEGQAILIAHGFQRAE